MNETVMIEWIDKCWKTRPGAFFQTKQSLLIMDSMASHKKDTVKDNLLKCKTQLAIIPGGLTCKLQPLDLTVNRVFKDRMRYIWEKWMTEGDHTFTKSGRMRRASYQEVCAWVGQAWKEVPTSVIQSGFRRGGLLNDISHIDAAINTESDENDDYETQYCLSDPEMIKLFESDVGEDSDFDGF